MPALPMTLDSAIALARSGTERKFGWRGGLSLRKGQRTARPTAGLR